MKRFKTLISYTLYTLLCVVFLSSCREQVPVKNYKGAIIHKKANNDKYK